MPWLVAGLALAVVVGVPLVISGPGNDLDVGNVMRSGRSIARDFSYLPSRAPGSPVHETIVGVLDRLGGTTLTNLASMAAAVALLVGLDRLLRGEGLGPGRRWAVALVAANPWFLIAATSTTDYLFALGFVVFAALALRRDRPVAAGVLAAAAMGCRIGSAVLIAAVLLAELTAPTAPATFDGRAGGAGPDHDHRPARRAALVRVGLTAVVAAAATVVLFVPSYRQAGGLSFAQNDFSTSSPLVQLGRALVKDVTLLGPVATLVALVAVPALWRTLGTWRSSWLIRFAVPGLVLSQLLFIRFPWKVPHLLPVLVCLALWLGLALADRPRLLMVLVALQLLFSVVRLDVIAPDDPNQATAGELDIGVGWGPVVVDWQCRRQDPDAYRGRQKVEIERAWNCARPFGTGPD